VPGNEIFLPESIVASASIVPREVSGIYLKGFLSQSEFWQRALKLQFSKFRSIAVDAFKVYIRCSFLYSVLKAFFGTSKCLISLRLNPKLCLSEVALKIVLPKAKEF
jgi:hypothetical protein